MFSIAAVSPVLQPRMGASSLLKDF